MLHPRLLNVFPSVSLSSQQEKNTAIGDEDTLSPFMRILHFPNGGALIANVWFLLGFDCTRSLSLSACSCCTTRGHSVLSTPVTPGMTSHSCLATFKLLHIVNAESSRNVGVSLVRFAAEEACTVAHSTGERWACHLMDMRLKRLTMSFLDSSSH